MQDILAVTVSAQFQFLMLKWVSREKTHNLCVLLTSCEAAIPAADFSDLSEAGFFRVGTLVLFHTNTGE